MQYTNRYGFAYAVCKNNTKFPDLVLDINTGHPKKIQYWSKSILNDYFQFQRERCNLCWLIMYFTMQTQSCLVPPVSSHVVDSHPGRLNRHPGVQRFFLCHKCLHIYPEPGHRHYITHYHASTTEPTSKPPKVKRNPPFA